MTKPWTHDAPCNTCGQPARHHDADGTAFGCDRYTPVACQDTAGPHGGPVRVRIDDAELCFSHEERRRTDAGYGQGDTPCEPRRSSYGRGRDGEYAYERAVTKWQRYLAAAPTAEEDHHDPVR